MGPTVLHKTKKGRARRLVLGAMLVGTIAVTSGCAVRKAVKVTGKTASTVVKTTGSVARRPWN